MLYIRINLPTQYIDFESLHGLQLEVNTVLVKENELLSQTNTSLHLQILELQKFIYGGKQEKFKPDPNSNALQTTLFDKDKLGKVLVESI